VKIEQKIEESKQKSLNNLCVFSIFPFPLCVYKKIIKDNGIQSWRWISKEVLETVSEKLNDNLSRIKLIFSNKKRGIIDEILTSLS